MFGGNYQNQKNKNPGLIQDPFNGNQGQQQIPFKERISQKKPNPFGEEQIQPKGSSMANANIQSFVNNSNGSQLQQSIYMDDIAETGLSLEDSPLNNSKFNCSCKKSIGQKEELIAHAYECKCMQQDGYASFVQVIQGLMQQNQDANNIKNLRSIFNILVQDAQKQAIQVQAPLEEAKDSDMIDSSAFKPPYQEAQQKVSNVDNMEMFMDPQERKRAQTYYRQMEQEAQDRMCHFCMKQITDAELNAGSVTMVQSTDCFHQVHIDCLREEAIKRMSDNETTKCPRCKGVIQTYELMNYLSKEEQEKIEKSQTMQIVKLNPNFVSCSCGNIMELVAGDIVKGQKDEKGQLVSKEAAQHMASNRIRCNGCQKNFCASCNADPYHVGKTCDQNNAKACRFCGEELKQPSPSMKPAFRDVCRKGDCFNLMQKSCDKMLACGHVCRGSAGEKQCLPCLEPECIEKMSKDAAPKYNAEDFCSICYCSSLGQEPCVVLGCHHVFHVGCIKGLIQKGYNGPRIVFNFLDCPDCKQRMDAKQCPEIQKEIAKQEAFEKIIKSKAVERAKFEDLHKDPRLKKKGDRFYNDLEAFALQKLSYYQCFKCQDPYFGGMKQCDAVNDYNDFKKEELVCGKCAAVAVGGGDKNCPKHGTDFIEFKCKFCCSIAQWFCWGNTHFCEGCHKRQCNGDYVSRKPRDQLPKCDAKKCPLKVKHPPNGEEYALGCSVCRNMRENMKDF